MRIKKNLVLPFDVTSKLLQFVIGGDDRIAHGCAFPAACFERWISDRNKQSADHVTERLAISAGLGIQPIAKPSKHEEKTMPIKAKTASRIGDMPTDRMNKEMAIGQAAKAPTIAAKIALPCELEPIS